MRAGARLFAGLLLVCVLAMLPTPATAFLHDAEAANTTAAHRPPAAILTADHKPAVAPAHFKKPSDAGCALIASGAERLGPSLRFEPVCYFAKPPRAADLRGRAYDATGPPWL
jgi:hypothetical protein